MIPFPELLEDYLFKNKRFEDLSPIYIEILEWLDSDKENYILTINKLTQICNYILSSFKSNEQISTQLIYISPDILSIIYDRSSKCINFPDSCYCKIDNPFENFYGFELECEFWKLLCELSMKVALKCSPKEGYVIFIEVILGNISLPIFSDKSLLPLKNQENLEMQEKTNPILTLEGKKKLPRFYRYLGLYYSLICISRMKRNKAQFITTVCSLVLRKFVYDIECDSLYSCNCYSKNTKINRYCTTAKLYFLQYLVNNIILLLFDCLEESKSDAEYKNQEIGIFNSEISEGNVNVTQHAIYSFLMKILENIIVIDLHDIEILNNSNINLNKDSSNNNIELFSSDLGNNPLNSILNAISSDLFNAEVQASPNIYFKFKWVEIIYMLCYNISYVSPYSMIDTMNNIPICVYDIETQSGDLDVTSLTLSCYAYALFVTLETKCPLALNYIFPKNMVSLQTKLNIIYRTTTIFLIYSDHNKLGYEIKFTSLEKQDILLSYFNVFQPKNISKSLELINLYYTLIYNRLQEKAYFLIDSNINNFIKCREIAPSLFSSIHSLTWHPNILTRQLMLSFTRNGLYTMSANNYSNVISSKLRIDVNLYSNLFEKYTRSMNRCYSYSVLFSLYFNLMEFQKDLFSKGIIHSAKVITGILNILHLIIWENICNENCDILVHTGNLNKMIMFSSAFLTKFKNVNPESSQSDKMILIVLNSLKLILLTYKNKKTSYLKNVVKYLVEGQGIIKKYIAHIKSNIFEIKGQSFHQFDIVLFIIQDIEELLKQEYSF